MQYRLSTIFLVFFVSATSLALFGAIGLWVAFVLCVAALAFNKAKTTVDGGIRVFYIILIGIVCPGVLIPMHPLRAREAARRVQCANNLHQIGLALLNYEDVHHHFPVVETCDKDGKPLYSWMVEILPQLGREDIYEMLHKDEPWDSAHNAGILQVKISLYDCPNAVYVNKGFATNYTAIIGPGTIWRKEGAVSMKDLANPSLTVMAVECVDSDKHWAEPYVLTAEEVLERMNTGKGMRIGSAHPAVILVLFADGNVQPLRVDMPISLWRKLLMGDIKNFEELNDWRENPGNRPPQFGLWAGVLSFVVWLISVLLLFYRAWASRDDRKKPETPV